MTKPRVFITRTIPSKGLDMIREVAEMEVWPGEFPPPYETLLEKVRGIDGLLCTVEDRIDARLMDTAGPSLKVISQYAVGYDNIDIAAATARGIPVGHTPGVLTDATADMAWALILATARRVVEGHLYVKEGRWKTWHPTLLLGMSVHGATLGIVGFGRIGQAVARRAQGFDMRVLAYSRSPSQEAAQRLGVELVPDLDTLLRESDIITLHVPLTQETYHMIGERELGLMKPTAILVNTARGPVVDPDALYRALKEKRIAYAGLDVTEPEPLPPDSPLLTLDNIVITPHIGSATHHARTAMAEIAARNLIAGLRGERLPYCVNPEVYTQDNGPRTMV